jgi:hypothetical protein
MEDAQHRDSLYIEVAEALCTRSKSIGRLSRCRFHGKTPERNENIVLNRPPPSNLR